MSGTTQHHRLLAKYARHSRLLGWILALFAVLVIGAGVSIGGGWGVFVGAVGASLLPVAIVNAWLDPLLREDAAHDLRVLLDVREDLIATGFQGACRSPAFDIGNFVGRTNELDIVPLNISDWVNRDYNKILELCRLIRIQGVAGA